MKWVISFVCAWSVMVGGLFAQDASKPGVMDFVTDDTVFVASANLDRFDLNAAEKFISDIILRSIDEQDVPEAKKQIAQVSMVARGLHAELKAAGVKDVYWMLHVTKGDRAVIVLPGAADPQALATKMRALAGEQKVTVERGGVIIWDRRPDPAGIVPTQERLDVQHALIGRDAPLLFAFTVPQRVRMAMPRNLPPQLGGADLAPIQEGFQWGVAELRLAPEASMKVLIQMTDQENAEAGLELLRSILQAMGKFKHGPEPAMFAGLIEKHAMPTVQKDQLVTNLGPAQVQELANQISVALRNARAQALRVASMSNMRQILMAAHMYRNENKGEYPNSMEQLVTILKNDRVFTNPNRPAQKPAYIYVKQNKDAAGSMVMLYEAYDMWPGVLAVGYADGHVETIDNEQVFLQQLEKSGGKR